jgi:hypothetical protein
MRGLWPICDGVAQSRENFKLDSSSSKRPVKTEEQGAMIAQQQKQIEPLTAGLQKLSAQLETSKPATQTVLNNQ